MSKFIVWVGGVADYEGNDLNQAKTVYQEWIEQDYNDVILEEVIS
jgi:hypothetical protein